MEGTQLQRSTPYENWNKIKKILKSSKKLQFLNGLSSIETNLFVKEGNEQNKIVNYSKINEIILKIYNNDLKFKQIKVIKPETLFEDKENLINFYREKADNTGNIQLWPCEEVLAMYCLLNAEIFYNKKIIELGSGFSGLVGLNLIINIPKNSKVVITDGNNKCVESIRNNIIINSLNDDNKIKADLLFWDKNNSFENNPYKNHFDVVLISDCLFFKNYHVDLIHTIYNVLIDNGICIIISPVRGDTMDNFIKLAENFFEISKSFEELKFLKYTIDDEDNKFCPFFIKLTKK